MIEEVNKLKSQREIPITAITCGMLLELQIDLYTKCKLISVNTL